MARGNFYVVGKGNEIETVTGYKYPLSTSKGGLIEIGIYRPNWARCWYVIERTTGLYICTGGTKNEAISNAMNRADAVYNLLTEADKNPESGVRKARDRMSAYVKEKAEEPLQPLE